VSKLTAFLPDVLLLGGAVALSYGAWLIYQPAGFIVVGALALLGGVLLSRSAG
jgi:hypothetical protein